MAGPPGTDRYIWPLVAKERIAAEGPVVLSEGQGSRVTDSSGKSYLDLSSGITRASSLGYGNEEIADAVHAQLKRLHYAGTAEYQADVVFELAERLAELTPGPLGPSYFTESGTAANEAAFKLARHYQQATGKPRAYKVISRWNAYHGAIGTPMAASDWLGVRLPADPGVPGVSFVPAPTCYRGPSGVGGAPGTGYYLDLLEQQILHEGPELVAAVIAEPVMQANGVQIPPADYFPAVREICTRYDVLFIADEVITGFGRTGEWFAIEHWGVEPDMITMAKALTAGYMPLGAAIVREDIWDALAGLSRRPHLRRPRRRRSRRPEGDRDLRARGSHRAGARCRRADAGPPAPPRAARGRRRGPRPRDVGRGRLHQRSRDPRPL